MIDGELTNVYQIIVDTWSALSKPLHLTILA